MYFAKEDIKFSSNHLYYLIDNVIYAHNDTVLFANQIKRQIH